MVIRWAEVDIRVLPEATEVPIRPTMVLTIVERGARYDVDQVSLQWCTGCDFGLDMTMFRTIELCFTWSLLQDYVWRYGKSFWLGGSKDVVGKKGERYLFLVLAIYTLTADS